MRKIAINETALRDGQQSLLATRLPYERFEAILPTMDKVGYGAVECWGGATFDVCLRFLNEDPWERLRKLRAAMPHTKLKMLLRGQNILGYKHYPDDIVREFVRCAVKNGIDIIRIFDALNDVRNMEVAIDETLKQGAEAVGDISYTTSPVHTRERYVEMAKTLKKMGVGAISIKDMAGILDPKAAYDLVSALKDGVDLPVIVHTHCTPGLGYMTYLKAVEAGADAIETASAALSGGASQPATETMAYVLEQFGYEVGLDKERLQEVSSFFKPVRDEGLASGLLDPLVLATDTDCLNYQIPGGMLSNLISQLKMLKAEDRLAEVLLETPHVREDLGYPPLVTPTSQMVGVQAVQNVLAGERYKRVGKEVAAYVRGEYGQTPAPVKPEIAEKVLGDTKPIEGRFADSLPPIFEQTKKELAGTLDTDEDVLSHILFPGVADKFFEWRKNGGKATEEDKLPASPQLQGAAVAYTIEEAKSLSSYVSEETAAVIMTAVAAEMGVPVEMLRFRDIREA
ncbi:MAG: pyruvate carboxylase subunit B [Oscillospiraceae bacterium]|nr:pyruvate carboxylase subunit B [Oscillospiraceae bacterium]